MNYPFVELVDVEYTMEKYEFPKEVKEYIINNWKKIDDYNGGTYQKISKCEIKM